MLNVAYLPEFIEWKISQNFKNIHSNWLDGRLLYANILEYPKYLNMNILPTNYKDLIKDKFKSYKIPNTYKKNYNRIVNDTLNYMYSESNTDQLPVSKEYLEGLDVIRGTDFRKTFPILADLF